MVRCGELDLICFQFKNYQEPYKKSKFIEEMRKCIVPGWNVTVVLVCSSGCNDDNNNENVNSDILITYPDIVELKDMKGILLSSTSVKEFLEKIQFQNCHPLQCMKMQVNDKKKLNYQRAMRKKFQQILKISNFNIHEKIHEKIMQ
mmetsp:Transcript_16501/g.17248  ORF Transcript_16501/g.17248 Transcript_16501/m.17248 type:complete len:146 (+) Transcript_16501:385-822(+)